MNPRESKYAVTGGDERGITVLGSHQSIHQPGLPAEFGGHPSGGVSDIRKGADSIRIQSIQRV
jgi:hypothetical protein